MVDLDPGVTYHVRAFAIGDETAETSLAAAPGSGTITQPAPIPPLKPQRCIRSCGARRHRGRSA